MHNYRADVIPTQSDGRVTDQRFVQFVYIICVLDFHM